MSSRELIYIEIEFHLIKYAIVEYMTFTKKEGKVHDLTSRNQW
jgi:hypothetical protein